MAWETVMLPQQAGGLNIVNIKLWNRAPICKHLWRLNMRKETLWIKWVHGYYIKQQDLLTMNIPVQISWMMKKILGIRSHLLGTTQRVDWLSNYVFSITKLYRELVGQVQKVPWAKIICQNGAPPKCKFIMWLALHEQLATCSWLRKFGVVVDPTCCFCGEDEETMDHLFFDCRFSKEVWTQVASWCGIRRVAMRWDVERIFLISQCSTNNITQRFYRCIVSVLIYQIWIARNCWRMQNQRIQIDGVVKQCKFLLLWSCSKDRKLKSIVSRLGT